MLLLLCGIAIAQTTVMDGKLVFTMHQQTRRYEVKITEQRDSIWLNWKIYHNFRWQEGKYAMSQKSLEYGNALSWLQPIDGKSEILPENETFAFISRQAWRDLHNKGWFIYNQTTYRLNTQNPQKYEFRGAQLLPVVAEIDPTQMWIVDNENLPFIVRLSNNPLGIDWIAE